MEEAKPSSSDNITPLRRKDPVQHDADINRLVFGSFDGMCCVIGVIAAGYITGDLHALILAAIGLGIAECVAMAGGSYLSELVDVQRMRHAAIIGGAALVGVLIPALPFLFAPKTLAVALSAVLTCLLAVCIAQVRVGSLGVIAAYVQTFAIVVVAAAVSVAVTLLLNGAGV